MQFDYYSRLRYSKASRFESVHMEPRSRRIEKLEQILVELLEIHSLSPGGRRAWLDLAITETRTQIEKIRAETVH